MKHALMALLVGCAGLGAPAIAATNFEIICNSCSPFSQSSSAVLAAAVGEASAGGAIVGDYVGVCKNVGPDLHASWITYSINSAPVTSSSNLTWYGNNGYSDINCEGEPI